MKKLLINITLILISLIIPDNVYALSTTETTEKIDIIKDCSLTINYEYKDYNIDDITVDIYYVASITSDFRYQLSSNFSNYSIKINDLKTEKEWITLKQTLNAYIETGTIAKTLSKTIKNNIIKLPNLKAGLYFIKTKKINTEDYTLLFDNLLISIPYLQEDGTWNYDINTYPKIEEYVPKYKQINYTVIKEWIDDKDTRPKSIDIEIYKEEKLVETKTLSSKNNWTYTWTTDDDSSTWTVIEKNIPTGYKVSIQNNNKTFIIVNTAPNYKEDNPYTLDNINLYLYLLICSLIGIILLIISLILKKK